MPEPREFRITADAVGTLSIRADAAGGKKLPTFSGNAYTGAPMRPEGWYRPVVIDLAGVKIPSQHRPILRQHDHTRIVGHSTSVEVAPDGIRVAGVMSGHPDHTAEVLHLARNGFRWQMSVGANPIRTEELEAGKEAEVNGRTVAGPLTISRETELGEISFVPLGADGATSATVHASKRRFPVTAKETLKSLVAEGLIRAGKYSDDDVDKMDEAEAKAALKKCMKAADGEEEEKEGEKEEKKEDEKTAEARISNAIAAATARGIDAARRATAEEQKRCDAVRAAVAKHGLPDAVEFEAEGKTIKGNLASHAIAAGWTPERAELYALRLARPGPGVGNGPHVYSSSRPEVTEAVLEAAVLHAARHQFALEDDSFYSEPTPDGRGTIRRVPVHLQREAQGGLKARYTDQVQQAAHTIFKGRIAPRQIIEAAFSAWGHRRELDMTGEHGVRSMLSAWDHYERTAIRADGSSTISISNVLANVMNKFALQGYLFTEQSWREFCGVRPVSDFKPTKSINLLGDVMYKQLGPTGELSNASLGDQAFANVAAPFGRILTIPWTHIVNDDLGILTGAPQKIGQGAGLALNDQIWALWASLASGSVVSPIPAGYNLNGDDGNAFWRTSSSTTAAAKLAGTAYKANKTSGAGTALSPTSLQTVKALFDNQIDPNGNPLGFDGMQPVLLFGPSNWQTAMALLQASAIVYGGASTALQPNVNIWQGKFRPVMSRYVESPSYVNSATAWWMLFNPVALAVLEVCFLNGVDTPAVLQAGPDYQFDRLGISIRGTMPFGVNQQNFRGGVYSVGA